MMKANKVTPSKIQPNHPTISTIKPMIPKTMIMELMKYGIIFKARQIT